MKVNINQQTLNFQRVHSIKLNHWLYLYRNTPKKLKRRANVAVNDDDRDQFK
jgi:hypothetical protein